MFTIPASTSAPHRARQTLAKLLEGDDRRDDILLAISELVSNAVIHGDLDEGDPICLEMQRRRGRVRVCVSHPGPPVARPPRRGGASRPGGHGFSILEQVVTRWDVEHRDGVTRAWFET